MALSTMFIDENTVSPRGGRTGDVTVPGEGFGSLAGSVRFDPLGENVAASIVSWAPDEVVFTIPVLSGDNRTVPVEITHASGNDSVVMPFWYPRAPVAGPAVPARARLPVAGRRGRERGAGRRQPARSHGG